MITPVSLRRVFNSSTRELYWVVNEFNVSVSELIMFWIFFLTSSSEDCIKRSLFVAIVVLTADILDFVCAISEVNLL